MAQHSIPVVARKAGRLGPRMNLFISAAAFMFLALILCMQMAQAA